MGASQVDSYLGGSTFQLRANGAIKQGPYGDRGPGVLQKQQGSQPGQEQKPRGAHLQGAHTWKQAEQQSPSRTP